MMPSTTIARPIEEWGDDWPTVIWVTGPDEEFDHYVGSPLHSDWPVGFDGNPVFSWWIPFPNYDFPEVT